MEVLRLIAIAALFAYGLYHTWSVLRRAFAELFELGSEQADDRPDREEDSANVGGSNTSGSILERVHPYLGICVGLAVLGCGMLAIPWVGHFTAEWLIDAYSPENLAVVVEAIWYGLPVIALVGAIRIRWTASELAFYRWWLGCAAFIWLVPPASAKLAIPGLAGLVWGLLYGWYAMLVVWVGILVKRRQWIGAAALVVVPLGFVVVSMVGLHLDMRDIAETMADGFGNMFSH